jgi:hypothetical protein
LLPTITTKVWVIHASFQQLNRQFGCCLYEFFSFTRGGSAKNGWTKHPALGFREASGELRALAWELQHWLGHAHGLFCSCAGHTQQEV